MTLAQLGEDTLVAQIIRSLTPGKNVILGAGDDCAIIGTPRAREWTLLKTDAIIEGVHFLPGENPRRIGWKALCRAISDIAAMGGEPRHALITIALPATADAALVRGIYAGLNKAARRFGIGIVGGETSRSPAPLFINVALTGTVAPRECALRSGAKPGHKIYVTGHLGGSIAGHHLDFIPRLAEARWLVKNHRPSAMMDLSDGLAADLPRMARASHCGYQLDQTAIPRNPGTPLHAALHDGEDFELLFASPPTHAATLERHWRTQFPRVPLTCIGEFNKAAKAHLQGGFDHFSQLP